jgi:hypothetical protein
MALTRDGINRDHYMAPRKLAKEAAVRIVGGAEILGTMDRFGTLIARARLRRRPTIEPASAEEFEAQFTRASDDMWKAVDRLMAAEKKNPLAHLNVKPDAERAWDRFNKALEQARLTGENVPNCQDRPAEFVDYDEEGLPTAEEAYRLCYGCPLLELCATYAEQERPAWGVHAQGVWVAGEIVNNE